VVGWLGMGPRPWSSLHIVLRTTAGGVTLDYRARTGGGPWHPITETIAVVWTPCRFGGQRPWWSCPGYGRLCVVLWGLTTFRCRRCHRLTYLSQREREMDRAARRGTKIRARLGWEPGWGNIPRRPRGMHRRTFERHLDEIMQADAVLDDFAARMLARERRAGEHTRSDSRGYGS